MSTSHDRAFRAEVLKECLSAVSGDFFRLRTKKGKELSLEAGILANKLFLPEYDSDEALDTVQEEYENYIKTYEELKKMHNNRDKQKGDKCMNANYERTFRAEVLKECLASVAGQAFWLETKEGKELCFKAGVLANKLLLPEYDSDEALDEAKRQYQEFQKQYERLEKSKNS